MISSPDNIWAKELLGKSDCNVETTIVSYLKNSSCEKAYFKKGDESSIVICLFADGISSVKIDSYLDGYHVDNEFLSDTSFWNKLYSNKQVVPGINNLDDYEKLGYIKIF